MRSQHIPLRCRLRVAISSIFVSFTFCTVNLIVTRLKRYLSVAVYKVSVSKTREKKKKWSPVRREKNKTKRKILLCYLLPLQIPIASPNVSLCVVASPSVHIHIAPTSTSMSINMLLSCMGPLFPAHQAYAYSKEYEARYHYVYVQRKDSD